MSLEDIEQAINKLNRKFVEWDMENPFGKGVITEDGVQYCTEKTTDTLSVYRTVEEVTVGRGRTPGTLVALSFGLTCSLAAASTATASVFRQWQIADMEGKNWVDLHTAVEIDNINTTNVERTDSGNFAVGNADGRLPITRLPFKMRLQIKSDEANEGQGKTKNSSWVKYWYIPD